MATDYEIFEQSNLKAGLFVDGMHNKNRHPMSIRIGKFLGKIDFNDFQDSLGWNFGGDGDNGEILLDQLDAFFYTLGKTND